MSVAAESAFTESEKFHLLAEILKDALHVDGLLKIVQEYKIQPRWNEIALPTGEMLDGRFVVDIKRYQVFQLTALAAGRSLSSCQRAYDEILSSEESREPERDSPTSKKGRKQPMSGSDNPTSTRSIQPRPLTFAPVNGLEYTQSSYVTTQGQVDPSKKKRGRPSKAELELRTAEAAARGELYPPPKKAKTPRSSTERGAPVAVMSAHVKDVAPWTEKNVIDKKGGAYDDTGDSHKAQAALEAAAAAAEQIQSRLEDSPSHFAPKTHITATPGPRIFPAAMQGPTDQESGPDVKMKEFDVGQSNIASPPPANLTPDSKSVDE